MVGVTTRDDSYEDSLWISYLFVTLYIYCFGKHLLSLLKVEGPLLGLDDQERVGGSTRHPRRSSLRGPEREGMKVRESLD